MKKIITITILSIITILFITFIILPKKSFSEIENRPLDNLSKISIENIIDGTYMEDIETKVREKLGLN